jgi:hypothetical protein
MKTKTDISRLAKTGLTALAALFISTFLIAQGQFEKVSYIGKNLTKASSHDAYSAHDRLEALNNSVEALVEYKAPSVSEDVEAFELQAAKDRLDNLNLAVQGSLQYHASMINEEADAHELAAAKERLESMSLAIEESMRFYAPETLENEILQDKIEYVSKKGYIIPVSGISMNLVLAR